MLLACFTPFVTCYLCTLRCFNAFSVTNLLTRCRSASSLFPVVFGLKKVIHEIFSELDETKDEVPIFPDTSKKSEGESKKHSRAATPTVGAPLAAPRHGVGPLASTDIALSPI